MNGLIFSKLTMVDYYSKDKGSLSPRESEIYLNPIHIEYLRKLDSGHTMVYMGNKKIEVKESVEDIFSELRKGMSEISKIRIN